MQSAARRRGGSAQRLAPAERAARPRSSTQHEQPQNMTNKLINPRSTLIKAPRLPEARLSGFVCREARRDRILWRSGNQWIIQQ
jgi:hypothetical protein